jgi:hypothetical protein
VARGARLLGLRLSAAFFAFVFWVPSLALTDLVAALIPVHSEPKSSHAAGNLAYGIIGAVLVAPAFASQAHRPERKIAPLQQLALVILALGLAAVGSGAYMGIAGAAVVLVPLVIVLAVHPARGAVSRQRPRPSLPLVALALAALVPALAYAWKMAANGRANLPPEDSYAYVPTVWSGIVAMAFATISISFLAALRPRGWPIPAACVAVAAFLFGTASVINPDIPASGGRGWGATAILWSVAWSVAAILERNLGVTSEQRE